MQASLRQKIFFLTVTALLGVYIVLRAIYTPLVHDEAATFFYYIQTGEYWPFTAHWDANNHVLNSMFAHGAYALFGKSSLAIRLPNVLAFFIFSFYSWKLAANMKSRFGRELLFLALVTARFVFEFFALSRGYGLATAFMMGALYHFCRYTESRLLRDFVFTLVYTALALWSNLSWMNSVLLIILGLTIIAVIDHFKQRCPLRPGHINALLLAGVIPVMIAVFFSFGLKNKDLLYYGSLQGFGEVTIRSLLQWQIGPYSLMPRIFVVMIFAGLLGYAVFLLQKREGRAMRLFYISMALMLANWLMIEILARVLKVNYPEDRAALFFIPLFIISVALALDKIAQHRPAMRYSLALLLFFPAQLIASLNTDHSHLWLGQCIPSAFYQRVAAESDHKATVSTYLLQQISWAFTNLDAPRSLAPAQITGYPSAIAEWLVIDSNRITTLAAQYDPVLYDKGNNLFLLKRKTELGRTLILQTTPPADTAARKEFIGFLDLTDSIPGGPLFFELEGRVQSSGPLPDVHLVTAATNSSGEVVFYDFVPLSWIRSDWTDSTLKISRNIPLTREATGLRIYIWNSRKAPLFITGSSIKLYQLNTNTAQYATR